MRNRKSHSRNRAGTTLTELVVSGSLLIVATGLVATSAVGSHRLHHIENQRRVAIDEISNQLERLTMLEESQIETALVELAVSEWAAHRLPAAELTGDWIDDENGKRIQLNIQWQRTGESKPVSAVAWLADQGERRSDTPL